MEEEEEREREREREREKEKKRVSNVAHIPKSPLTQVSQLLGHAYDRGNR